MVNETVAKLRALGQPKAIIVKGSEGDLKFTVKPLSAKTLAVANANGKPVDMDKAGEMEIFSNMLYPMMEVIFPACCVEPKVCIDEKDIDDDTVWIEEIDMLGSSNLLDEILKVSGLKDAKKKTVEETDTIKN